MVTIKCTQYELGDFERYLEKLKEYIKKDEPKKHDHFDSRKYDLERINILLQRVKGNYQECYIQNSREFRGNY